MAETPPFSEPLPFLKSLPLAPEYRPSLSEFQDPISYILKIEPEASRYGICKIIPPLPAAPRSTALSNLNLSFSARSPSGAPTFSTRQQQIGFCPRRPRPVQKSVWQSGSRYTLPQFQAKARAFERSHLTRSRKRKKASSFLAPIEVESLFWKTAADKPSTVEYANDIPGSGFVRERGAGDAENVGESEWNMRGVARAKGSLLRFMREEIAGVTSPMVYVAMLFSWFAWHVEDHDLHSLNYLHLGAGKTWYGVPRDAALAFEEVVRVYGYGGEVNALITFATLAEKTTLMSPEVLIGSGIPCCRLVQNAGEFVVTFPGSYHSGFSHGFNCGEASNIATPEWLKVAKEAAIRRASTNCPPMVSHYQLLYALALSLCSRSPSRIVSTPKSSRLKNKLRCVGETMIKETLVQNVIRNNILLNTLLDDGSSCLILPQRAFDKPLCSGLHRKLQMKVKPRIALGLCHGEDKKEGNSVSDFSVGRRTWARCSNGFCPAEENSDSENHRKNLSTTKICSVGSSVLHNLSSEMHNKEVQNNKHRTDGVLDQGLLSCVTCGILSYACVAIMQPREAAVKYLMSSNCNSFANPIVGFEENCGLNNETTRMTLNSDVEINLGLIEKIHSSVQVPFNNDGLLSNTKVEREASALDLLASAYGDLSDSEEDAVHDVSFGADGNKLTHSSLRCILDQQSMNTITYEDRSHIEFSSNEGETIFTTNDQNRTTGICSSSSMFIHCSKAVSKGSCAHKSCQLHGDGNYDTLCEEKTAQLSGSQQDTIEKSVPSRFVDYSKMTTHSLLSEAICDLQSPDASRDLSSTYKTDPTTINLNDMIKDIKSDSNDFYPSGSFYESEIATGNTASTNFGHLDDSIKNTNMTVLQTSDKDSYRMHVFCLEHAVEVEKRLRPLGGVNLMLFCHPEYPKIESEAKLFAEELGLDHQWKDVEYRDASKQDQEKIRIAIEDEDAIPCNGDWAVKLGINLYYSVSLSQSPLFRKQLPYNEVIYKSFFQKSPIEQNSSGMISRRQKKIIFAGKWCGKVWMSNQVHPYLVDQNFPDDDDDIDLILVADNCRENGNQAIQYKRKSSNNNAADRTKSGKKRTKTEYLARTRKPGLDNSARYAEENSGYSGKADGDTDTVRSEADTDKEDDKQAILPRRNSTNNNAVARGKSHKKKSAVRSSTRKPVHTRLFNSSDIIYADDNSGNADGDTDTVRSEADTDVDDNKQAILPRRNSTNNNVVARGKSHKKKSAVRSSTRKPVHTRLFNSSDIIYADDNSGNADGDTDTVRSEADTDVDDNKQAILPRRNSTNNNVVARGKSHKKKSAVRSSTRKPVHTRHGISSDIIYADGDQDTDWSEADTDMEDDKQAILSRRNSTNNISSARRKAHNKRKQSSVISNTLKHAHTVPGDSSHHRYVKEKSEFAGNSDGDHPEDTDRSVADTDIESDRQTIMQRRNLTNNNVAVRKRSVKKRKSSTVRSSTRKPAHTHLEDSSDAGCAEENTGNADVDQDRDQSSEVETYSKNKKQASQPKRNLPNNNVAVRRRSVKNRKSSTVRSSSRKPEHTQLEDSSDAVCAEENTGNADVDQDRDQSSEADTYSKNKKQASQPKRNLPNNNVAVRRRSVKNRKGSTVRSSSRKPAHTQLEDSSDAGCAEENTGNADDDQGRDQSCEVETYSKNKKQASQPKRNLPNNNVAARRRSVKKRKRSTVRSSTRKPAHTQLEDSSDAGCAGQNTGNADDDQGRDQRSEVETYSKNKKQASQPKRNLPNNNVVTRRRSVKKRKSSTVRSSTRKPAHTQLKDSSDAGCAEENSGNADDDQDRDQNSEANTYSEDKKQASQPRRNLPNNNASAVKKSGWKRKRLKAGCNRKAACTKPDSSAIIEYSEDDFSIKRGRSLSCLRSSLKGTNREPRSMRLPKWRFNSDEVTVIAAPEKRNNRRKIKKAPDSVVPDKEDFSCDVEGCSMSFRTKHDLALHKQNVCPEKGCGKKFFSHKYLLQHRKVHSDERPLKCPWKGCKMTFKWAWARTEHIRVHTGERPYSCREPGCDLTFRFVSDFSRHRRKTGH